MLRRRLLLALVPAFSVFLCGAPAIASQVKHVVILESLNLPLIKEVTGWIRVQLAELGLREEANITYRVINAEGDPQRAEQSLGQALSERRPDLVVTVATLATRAGRKALSDTAIPQLFMLVTDPVAEGLTVRIGAPSGSNISGRSHVLGADVTVAQTARVLRKPDGSPFRVALIGTDYPSAVSNVADLLVSASRVESLELVPLILPFRPGDDGASAMLESAVALVQADTGGFDGLWLPVGPLAHDPGFRASIAARTDLQLVYGQTVDAVRGGALIALTSSAEVNGRAVGRMAAETLEGADPGTMPIERPDTFTAAVNVTTALTLGVTLPSDLLELAGPQVYR